MRTELRDCSLAACVVIGYFAAVIGMNYAAIWYWGSIPKSWFAVF